MLAMKVDGIGVAGPGDVPRIGFSSRETRERIVGSQVLISAGPFANGSPQRTPAAATILDPLGVGTPTLPPITPTPFRTMDGFASRRNCSSSSALHFLQKRRATVTGPGGRFGDLTADDFEVPVTRV